MIPSIKKYSSLFGGFLVTTLFLLTYNFSPSGLRPLENLFQNIHFKLRGPLPLKSDIVIAKIDEKSLDTLGRWPWSRQVMAKLVQKLNDYEAEVIGFDIIFSSPQSSADHEALKQLKSVIVQNPKAQILLDQLLKETNADAKFSQALSSGPKSVLGYFFHFSPEGLDHLTRTQRNLYFEDIKTSQIQLVSATLTVVKKVNCGNLAVYLTDKIKRSMHELLHTAYPRTTLPNGSPSQSRS